jgi:hypothetical protein
MTNNGASTSIHVQTRELHQNLRHGQIRQQNLQHQDQYPPQQHQIDRTEATAHTFLRIFSQK